jgi:hypothetical protein
MTRAPADAPATYFRLSDETWALIVEEYADGATARQLGAKWKVAPNSIYRHVGAAKMTKRDCGDQRARAHAKAVTLARKARDASLGPRAETVEPALTTLFVTTPDDQPADGDPAVLASLATLASGRAMKARMWVEARALAGLAESYMRLVRDGVAGPAGDRARREEADAVVLSDLRYRIAALARGTLAQEDGAGHPTEGHPDDDPA